MINIRLLGHIKTAVGREEVSLGDNVLDAAELVDRVRALSTSEDPGFTRYNTLVMVEDGEAFVPAPGGRLLRGGERVVLIPFSHGG